MSAIDVAQYTDFIRVVLEGGKLERAYHRAYESPSSLAMFLRCPRQYQERYIFGRKERPAEAPLIGTAVHAGVQFNFEQKIASHEDVATAELLDWYDEVGFPTTLDDQQERNGDVRWDTDPERAMVRGRVMLGEYHNQVAPRIQPLSVENEVSLNWGGPVPIMGRYDLEQQHSMVDLKTGKRASYKPKEAWRIQAAVYGEARGKPVEFHSLTATDNNAVTIVTPLEAEAMLVNPSASETERMRGDLRMMIAEIALYMEILGPERPWPTYGRYHDWACGYCGFRSTCPAWSEE